MIDTNYILEFFYKNYKTNVAFKSYTHNIFTVGILHQRYELKTNISALIQCVACFSMELIRTIRSFVLCFDGWSPLDSTNNGDQ